MADLSGEPQPLSFAIEGADKQHVAASVTAENADCDAKGSTATGADGATIDKDDIIRELMTQLQANTDRLATLEANIKTINGAVGLPENPVVHPEPVDAEGDHLYASRGPDEVETADSDTDDEDVEDDGDSEEDNAKRTAKITARRMKYLPSEEWIPNKISETYKIDDFLPSSLSVVVSLEAKVSMTHHVIHSTLPEADCGSKPETGRSRPDRLAIPCATLLSEIAKISGTIISTRTNVFVRPFKNVIPFREEYHESLIQSKEAYNKLKKLKKEKEASYAEACKVADELGEATPSKEEFHLSMADQSSLATARKLYLGLTCLLHFLDNDNAEIMYLRRQVKTRDFEISFEDLWHIFEPGQLVCPKGDKDQAYRVLNVGGGRPHRDMPDHDGSLQTKSKTQKVTDFFVDCFNTDFNGTHYVPTPLTMYIPPYDGTRPIKSLAVRPLEYLYSGEEEKDVRKKLVDRGKKFVRLAAVSHQRYSGLSLQDRDLRCEEVDGDVIIDFALAFKNNRVSLEERLMDPYISFQPPRSDISITDYYTPQSIEETREQCSASCSIPGCTMCPATVSYFYDDASFEFVRRTRFLEVSAALLKDIEQDLGDDRHLLLPYRMYGYVLLSRKWYPLDIDLLQDIDESHNESDGFKDLVLPEDHKQIVRALVKTHARGPRSASGEKDIPARQMDLVKGKGKGLIILLHGVPGVGKTSTAECVAAHTNRPLFPITCGDIGGQTPREVETNLESYFDLARKWGCVLLLDEADVFLGERTKGDILQNSLVSVFLRVLEYYSGVLILTTNRVGQFDEAIKSRIHISLYYPPLNKE